MSGDIEFTLEAQSRQDVGKGASRRLRREKKVPAVVYGGGKDAQSLTLNHNEVWRKLQFESFFSHIITLEIDGKQKQQAIVRDLQRHPFKPLIGHMDFQRIVADQELQVRVPLHYLNEEESVGVRMNGGEISHLESEVLVGCLPKHLPEYIEVDLTNLDVGDTLHMSDIQLPEGVRLVDLDHGEEYDRGIVSCHMPRVTTEEDLEDEAPEGEEEVEAGAEAGEGEEASGEESGEDSGKKSDDSESEEG
ncbi:MAG: 50S ribosomal protein L25/general stress protein Ctc [Halofilum sp. (in: g-proteobacteria)]|nr:50S ribosomal protein L25/general stress protein Ctc [Halofilum sp. (in: g-proteobacteria)]